MQSAEIEEFESGLALADLLNCLTPVQSLTTDFFSSLIWILGLNLNRSK